MNAQIISILSFSVPFVVLLIFNTIKRVKNKEKQ